MMTETRRAENLETIGRILYGSAWQTGTARTLGVADRTVRRWVARETPVPQGALDDMAKVLAEHADTAATTLRRVRDEIAGVDPALRREQCAAALDRNRDLIARLRTAEVVETERGRIQLGTLIGRYDAWQDGWLIHATAEEVTSDWVVSLTEDAREHRGEAGEFDEHGWLDAPKPRDQDGDDAAIAARLRLRVRNALIVHLTQRLIEVIETVQRQIDDAGGALTAPPA